MRAAVLTIDVQTALFEPPPRPFEADAVVARINDLTRRARAAGVPVLHIQHERPDSALARGSSGWQFQPALHIAAGDIIMAKTTPDAFLRTELQAWLNEHGIGRLIICGYASEFCVDTTTRRAAALGFEVVLAADAHTTHDKLHASAAQIRAHHNATLPGITSFGPLIAATPSAAITF
ncbi:cysteine hydrolase family protein [Chitinimonas sp.]|uniref:cysteine hydrolase family protein n=1 Tax=Chitinimonas sp. TaxID=1934313 RepID=UPI0035B04043